MLGRIALTAFAFVGFALSTASPGSAQTGGTAAPATMAPAAGAAAPAAPATPAPPPPKPVAFDDALMTAANALLSKAALPEGTDKIELVIDPLIDGVTGAQSRATQSIEKRIVELVHSKYPRFDVQPLSTDALDRQPVLLIGTFTPINNAGQAGGPRDAYRICLRLADLKTGKIISGGVARATPAGIDNTPTPYFADSPVFTKDGATEAYVKSCQGTKVGDSLDQAYSDQLRSGALISDAIKAYDAGRYEDALKLYDAALAAPGGDQLRVYNGVYLANWKLGNDAAAAEAFGKVVEYGLARERLGVKFLFRVGSTQFFANQSLTAPYPMWLNEIAAKAAEKNLCLQLVGHTSHTGPEAFNDTLSVERADRIKELLAAQSPDLGKRIATSGVGWRENLIGTGADDASDALDRRVEFKVGGTC
jgi:outer membrane protein OmpA-like peptidoglycan-associated protein